MSGDDVARAVEAIRAGLPVLLPADGVYGLCATAEGVEATRRLYELKGREARQPTALFAASVEQLLDCVPELGGAAGTIVRTLLPGPYTLVLANPARRYGWLNGDRPDTIGVRAPVLPEVTRRAVTEAGPVVATSANDPGGPAAASLDEVPERIRTGCAAELDAGRLSGESSTVIDFSGSAPVVLREGSASSADALARVREAFGG
jgi:L-threonylcarbamoyladenylate synthase